MNVLSLFDGISCGRVALERANIPVKKYYASEIQNYSIFIAKKNYPDTIEIGDVTEISSSRFSEPIDLLLGGSPCKNFSMVRIDNKDIACGCKTQEDEEILTLEQYLELKNNHVPFKGDSWLFWEYVRILNEVKPKYFLFENVPTKQKWVDMISNALGVRPIEINSKNFSAQDRKRLYWTNIPIHKKIPACRVVLGDILEDEVEKEFYCKQTYEFYGLEQRVCGKLDLNGHDIAKRVYSPYYKAPTITACRGGNLQKKVFDTKKKIPRSLTPVEYERLQTLPDNYTSGIAKTNRYNVCGDGWTVDVIAWILSNLNEIEDFE